jgi:hypothetical protein
MGRIVDLFIVTYGADAVWLKYCLATAHKHLTGHREVVVVAPSGEKEIEHTCHQYGARFSPIMDPDWICYIDSDCVFTHPVSVNDLFVNDRPILCFDGWEADHTHQWREGTERALGQKIELNYMRRHGMCYKPEHLHTLKDHLADTHQTDPYRYILEQWNEEDEWFPERSGGKMWQPFGKPKFSEFCLMGAWVWNNYPQDFCWWRIDDFGWPGKRRHSWCKQYWSHGEVTPEIQEELDKFL